MPGARNSTDGAMAPPCEFAAALAERDMSAVVRCSISDWLTGVWCWWRHSTYSCVPAHLQYINPTGIG